MKGKSATRRLPGGKVLLKPINKRKNCTSGETCDQTNSPTIPDFQECVNEAVKNYMDNVWTQKGQTLAPAMFGGPQLVAPTDQPAIQQIAGPALVPGMPVFAAVVPTYVPPAAATTDLNEFIHTGMGVLKKSLPKDRIRSGVSKTTNSRPQTARSRPPPTAESIQSVRPTVPISIPVPKLPPPDPSPTKNVPKPVPVTTAENGTTEPIVEDCAPDTAASPPPKSPAKNGSVSQKQFVNRASSPFKIKRPGTAKSMIKPELNENSKKDENDWHWSIYKENEDTMMGQTPKPPAANRPPSPPKRPNTASMRRPSARTPMATPIYNFSVNPYSNRPPSSVHSSPPMHFVSKEPTLKASPYEQALECWANDASDHEKTVVYNMMKSLNNRKPGFTASRLERARSSLQGSRPASPVRMTKYTPGRNGHKPAGVQTSVPVFGPPQDVEFVPTNENAIVTNYYQNLLDNIRSGNHQISPYYGKKEVRPMNRHKPRPALQKEYAHQGSFFNNSQLPHRSNFTIHPDWVSERKTLHVVNQRN
ncbi:uncharacterized protein LOC141905552 [Tubulanus polymorphus]|uniref:uncharacterized protein LOC141905552 n=1 Tax=Tubulanus polymorphus TaxID=672921 RepID=UPI003DA678BB